MGVPEARGSSTAPINRHKTISTRNEGRRMKDKGRGAEGRQKGEKKKERGGVHFIIPSRAQLG